MRIIAFTKYPYEGPSSRYRFYNYVNCFEKNNIIMELKPFFSSSYFNQKNIAFKLFSVITSYMSRIFQLIKLLIKPKQSDLVLIEYELLPFFPSIFERLLKLRGIKYLVDYDDAIFHKYDIHKNMLVRELLKEKIGKVMQNAEVVVVCNSYLEAYAKTYNTYTLRLPTVVLLENYKNVMCEYGKKDESRPFIIGWIGSKSTSVYMLDILPVMKRFAVAYDVEFRLVGFDESLLPLDEKEACNIEVVPWSEEGEVEEILEFDIGIMPLKNDPWSQGKCGFKLVQYMSCAKPVIASPVGINASLVKEGKNGFLAESEDEWFDAFEKLCLDKKLREKMGVNNMKKIETEYNHRINCEKYVQMIYEILEKERSSTDYANLTD